MFENRQLWGKFLITESGFNICCFNINKAAKILKATSLLPYFIVISRKKSAELSDNKLYILFLLRKHLST